MRTRSGIDGIDGSNFKIDIDNLYGKYSILVLKGCNRSSRSRD